MSANESADRGEPMPTTAQGCSRSLDSATTLARNVAHDFRNLLNAILLNLDMAQSPACSQQDRERNLKTARQTVQAAQDLTKELLAFPSIKVRSRRTPSPGGSLLSKVLVMDDELCMRMALNILLEGWGCQVSLTAHGQEAVDRYSSAKMLGSPFEVVILDLMVRDGLGGVEALDAMMRIDPAVQAIAITGQAGHPALLSPQHFGFKGILEKPFDAEELRELLTR